MLPPGLAGPYRHQMDPTPGIQAKGVCAGAKEGIPEGIPHCPSCWEAALSRRVGRQVSRSSSVSWGTRPGDPGVHLGGHWWRVREGILPMSSSGLRELGLFNLHETQKGSYLCPSEDGPGSALWAQEQDRRQWAQTRIQGYPFHLNIRKSSSSRVTGTDCPETMCSLPHWDMQTPPGHNPVPRALGWLCLSRKVTPNDPLWYLPTWAILWWGEDTHPKANLIVWSGLCVPFEHKMCCSFIFFLDLRGISS